MGVRKHHKRRQGRSVLDQPLTVRRDPERGEGEQRRELVCRGMAVRSATVNEAERSIEAVMATEKPTAVFDMQSFRVIDEVLVARGAEFGNQVPLLNTHFRFSVDDVLGSTRTIRIEGDSIVGRLHFADDETSMRTWNKVKAGHVTDVSVGYRAVEFVDIAPGKTQVVAGKHYTAGERTLRITTRWQIRELSVVPIGADSAAKFRSDDPPHLELTMNPQLRAYLESLGMRTDFDDAGAWKYFDALGGKARTAAVALHNVDPVGRAEIASDLAVIGESIAPLQRGAAAPLRPAGTEVISEPPTEEQIRQQVRTEDRARIASLRQMAGTQVPAEILNRAIDDGWNTERAGREFLTAIAEGQSPPVGTNSAVATAGRAPAVHSRSHERDVNVRSLTAQLAESIGLSPIDLEVQGLRDGNGRTVRLTEQDADLGRRNRMLHSMDFLRECMRIDGVRPADDSEGEFFRSAFSTTALQQVFTTNAYAKLVDGYTNTPNSTGWCQVGEVPNFVKQPEITLGKMGSPKLLERGGEATGGTLSSAQEEFRALRYAMKLQIPEEDIIDDRLMAILSTLPQEMGETFGEMGPDLVYSTLLANPTLAADSKAVFHADHGNTDTTALARSAIETGEIKMAKQRVNGRVVNNAPKYLITGTDLKHTALQLLNSDSIFIKGNTDAEQGNKNTIPAIGLTPVAEGRLTTAGVWDPLYGVQRAGSATNWWMMSNRRTLKIVYRSGTGRRPTMRTFVLSQGKWGIGWDMNLDIGVGFSDYLGAYRGNS